MPKLAKFHDKRELRAGGIIAGKIAALEESELFMLLSDCPGSTRTSCEAWIGHHCPASSGVWCCRSAQFSSPLTPNFAR